MRRLLILAAVLAAALAVAMLWVRQSLAGGELREAVEARLSAALGVPVSIGQLGISVFPRPSVSGSGVRVGDADVEAPSIRIERIRILPRLGSLLSGDIVVDEVQLDGFVVSVLRERERWRVPAAVPAPTSPGSDGVVIHRVRITDARVRVFDRVNGGITERGSIDDLDAAVVTEGGTLTLSSITGRIGGAAVAGEATVDSTDVRLDLTADAIADDDLPVFLALLGSERPGMLRLAEPAALSAAIRVDRGSSRLSGTGTLRAPGVILDPVRLHQFAAPFTIDGPRLEFAPATFTLYGGAHEGTVGVGLASSPPEWTIDSRVTGLDAGEFLAALSGHDPRFGGTASLSGALRGRVGEPPGRSARGRARIQVTDGVIREFPLLAAVNRTLRLAEQQGRDTHFERLSATLSIASGIATTGDLVLEASHLRVEAAGRIGADRSLDLEGIAAVSPDRSSAAIASIHELKGLRNARGEVEIPLTITGTLDGPVFALDVQSALRKGITDELKRRLRRIIR
jgi:uncharacterized protein involved in outer membrane biogenesis